jgi:hypothetical protein
LALLKLRRESAVEMWFTTNSSKGLQPRLKSSSTVLKTKEILRKRESENRKKMFVRKLKREVR